VTKKTIKNITKTSSKTKGSGSRSVKNIDNKKALTSQWGNKEVGINIINEPLGVYWSPHMLDLSTIKQIEKVRPTSRERIVDYQSLPGGDLLAKLYVFDFLSYEKSEIYLFFKRLGIYLFKLIRKLFYPVDLSPKPPLLLKKGRLNKEFLIWQDVSLINLIYFFAAGISRILQVIDLLVRYFWQSQVMRQRDEVIYFSTQTSRVEDIESDLPVQAQKIHAPKTKLFKKKTQPKKFWTEFFVPNIKSIFKIEDISWRSLASFVIISLVIVLPLISVNYWQQIQETKGKVLGQTERALKNLNLAQDNVKDMNFKSAGDYFSLATQDFVSAEKQLDDVKSFLTVLAEVIPTGNTFRSGKNLLDLGEHLSIAGEYTLGGLQILQADSNLTLTDKIKKFKLINQQVVAELILANENLLKVKENHLPENYQDQFTSLKAKLPIFISSLEKFDEMSDFALDFLGDNDFRRYLVIFQNDNELRATGGFMGSFALVDIKSGEVANIDMPAGGTYDVRAGFNYLLQSPNPMQLVNPRWEFQDSNWWPDWPTSAGKVSWFYNKSGGPTIDGVIAINSDWFGDLLDTLGEVKLPTTGQIINSANFELELQTAIELEAEDKIRPKQVLVDLAPSLLDKIFNAQSDKFLDLISILNKGLKEKDILINLTNAKSNQFVIENNWDGSIKDTQKDYLNVVATNIGGGKTDNVVNQNIYHQAQIMSDGSIIGTVLINRYHFGPTDTDFTNHANRSYLRVYVPLGSELISASGFKLPLESEFQDPADYLEEDDDLKLENLAYTDLDSDTNVYDEAGKTVFANWLTLSPGRSRDVVLVYKLPFKIGSNQPPKDKSWLGKISSALLPQQNYDSYSLLVQKQSGSNNGDFSSKLIYPENFQTQILYPKDLTGNNGEIIYQNTLDTDLFYLAGFRY